METERNIPVQNTMKDRERILIVDDMPANIRILGQLLRDRYDIRFATSGEKALAIAASDPPPDLILLDIMMPGMDGYEVCRRLKRNSRAEDIPVIFIRAKGEVEDETKGLETGAGRGKSTGENHRHGHRHFPGQDTVSL